MYDIVIRNGLIVTAAGSVQGDIAIQGQSIAAIGPDIPGNAAREIDAAGRLLLPGGVDAHTHFDLQAGAFRCVDDFPAGTRAALAGGVTAIVDHPSFGPADCRVSYQIEQYHQLADGHCYVDYGFHGVAQRLYPAMTQDMAALSEQGIASLKAYMTYDFKFSPAELRQLFAMAAAAGMLVTVHAEDDGMICSLRDKVCGAALTSPYYHSLTRPNVSEALAISQLLAAARDAGNAPVYIVHLSTREGLAAIRAARAAGQRNILAETCPQYLVLDSSCYLDRERGLEYMMCPPLRGSADNAALWEGLQTGDIQTVCTDHCAFSREQKQAGAEDFRQAPCGAPGVETRLDLLYSQGVAAGRISLERLAALIATNPAKAFGLYPRKGALAVGSDADVVLYDPERWHTLSALSSHGACDYSPYEGMRVQGGVDMVLLRGQVAYDEGKVLAAEGDGRFLSRRINFHELAAIR